MLSDSLAKGGLWTLEYRLEKNKKTRCTSNVYGDGILLLKESALPIQIENEFSYVLTEETKNSRRTKISVGFEKALLRSTQGQKSTELLLNKEGFWEKRAESILQHGKPGQDNRASRMIDVIFGKPNITISFSSFGEIFAKKITIPKKLRALAKETDLSPLLFLGMPQLPEQPIDIGDTWQGEREFLLPQASLPPVSIPIQYTLQEIKTTEEGNIAFLSLQGLQTIEKKQTATQEYRLQGFARFHLEEGRWIETSLKIKIFMQSFLQKDTSSLVLESQISCAVQSPE